MTPLAKTIYLKMLKNGMLHLGEQLAVGNIEMCRAEAELLSVVPDLVVNDQLPKHQEFVSSRMIAFFEKIGKGEIKGDKRFLNRYLEYWEVLKSELPKSSSS